MNNKTKEIVGINRYKEYDEQKNIKKNYFKGCLNCNGEQSTYFSEYDVCLGINKSKIQLKDYTSKCLLIEKDINFCPYCGKQLKKFLPKYID